MTMKNQQLAKQPSNYSNENTKRNELNKNPAKTLTSSLTLKKKTEKKKLLLKAKKKKCAQNLKKQRKENENRRR